MLRNSGKAGLVGWTLAGVLIWSNPAWTQTMGGYGGGGGGGGAGAGATGGTGIGTGAGVGTTSGGGIGSSSGVGTSAGSATAVTAQPIVLQVQKTTGSASSNPVGSWYGNPLSAGLPTGTGKLTGIWASTYTSTNAANANITGNINTSNLGGTTTQPGSILNRRGPAYTVSVVFPTTPPSPKQLQTEAQKVIDASSSLNMKDTIRVKMDGETVVMSGQVLSDREKRLAENLLRVSGIRLVQNNLQVVQAGPTPRQTSAP